MVVEIRERTELLTDVSQFDTSSQTVEPGMGDAVILHNRNGFWALVYMTKVYARQALNRELVIECRYARQPESNPELSASVFPEPDA